MRLHLTDDAQKGAGWADQERLAVTSDNGAAAGWLAACLHLVQETGWRKPRCPQSDLASAFDDAALGWELRAACPAEE